MPQSMRSMRDERPYYRDNEIKFVLSDCVGTGSECDKVLYSTVEIYIGDNNETPPVVVGDTL